MSQRAQNVDKIILQYRWCLFPNSQYEIYNKFDILIQKSKELMKVAILFLHIFIHEDHSLSYQIT